MRQNFRIGWRDLGTVCLLGTARAMTSLSLVIAYQNIATGVASSIHFLYPLAVACGMALFFRERISWQVVVAILVSLLGAVLLSAGDLNAGGRHALVDIQKNRRCVGGTYRNKRDKRPRFDIRGGAY